jgi:hypothetical protein
VETTFVNYCLQLRLVNKYSFQGVIGSLQAVQLDIYRGMKIWKLLTIQSRTWIWLRTSKLLALYMMYDVCKIIIINFFLLDFLCREK